MPSLQYPLNIFEENGINSAVRFTEYQRIAISDNIPANTITLYMPDDLQCPIETEWKDGEQLQLYGDFASFASKAVSGTSKFLAGNEKVKNFLGKDKTKKLRLFGKAVRENTKEIKGIIDTAKDFQDVGSFFTKTILNPGPCLLFSGVKLREFNMSFKMSPMSQREASEINKIINTFKGGHLPETQEGGMFLSYPNEYSIDFLFNGELNPFMPVLKRCVITNCEAVYTGEGFWAMTRDGVPATVELQLTFKEIEALTKEDLTFDNVKVNAYVQAFGNDNINPIDLINKNSSHENGYFTDKILGLHDGITGLI